MEQIGAILQRTKERTRLPALSNASSRKSELVRLFGSGQSFIGHFNPDYGVKIVNEPDKCFFMAYPTLAEIKAAFGEGAAKAWVVTQLYHLSEYCGVREKLTSGQLEGCAFAIDAEYSYLKVSELMLFFHRFKCGRYGRFYGSVDPLLIMSALRSFMDERSAAIDREDGKRREAEREAMAEGAVTRKRYEEMLESGEYVPATASERNGECCATPRQTAFASILTGFCTHCGKVPTEKKISRQNEKIGL